MSIFSRFFPARKRPGRKADEGSQATAQIPDPSVSNAENGTSTGDAFHVTWSSPTDPANPRNWSSREKWTVALAVGIVTFISPLSSTLLSASLPNIARELDIGGGVEAQITFSIYVLSWGTGPLLLSPASEVYGRIWVLQLGNLIFVAFSIACGFAQSSGQLIAFRLISGFGGSAVLAIDDGLIADMWPPDEIGQIVAIYSYLPLIGPAVGPIIGAAIAQYSTWRWSFWALAIAMAATSICGSFLFRETYHPYILRQKARAMRKHTGDSRYHAGDAELPPNPTKAIFTALARPLIMGLTQPVVVAFSLYLAYVWGLLYLLLSTFATLFQNEYGQSELISSLHYLSLGIGFYIGTQIGASLSDPLYKYLKKRNSGVGTPELRAPLMLFVAPLIPIGSLWYGWAAQARTHWIVPDIGVAIFGIGGLITYQGVQAYLLEAYPRYAASAISATTFARSITAFAFPLFAPAMYAALGYGWGNTLLAGLAILFGFPAPVLLWYYGAKLRAKSKYATEGLSEFEHSSPA